VRQDRPARLVVPVAEVNQFLIDEFQDAERERAAIKARFSRSTEKTCD